MIFGAVAISYKAMSPLQGQLAMALRTSGASFSVHQLLLAICWAPGGASPHQLIAPALITPPQQVHKPAEAGRLEVCSVPF